MTNGMQFEYVVLRYFSDLRTQEFLNVGLALYSKRHHYFRAKLISRYSRITDTFPGADGEFYRRYSMHLQSRLNAIQTQITKDQLELIDERPTGVEQLVSTVLPRDESSIRIGEVVPGVASELDIVFGELYERLVARYLKQPDRVSRSDRQIWEKYQRLLTKFDIADRLQRHVIETPVEVYEFEHAWKNGKWNVLQPISFDLVHPGSIRKKAREWLGTAVILDRSPELSKLYMLLGAPKSGKGDVEKAYGDARTILTEKANGTFRLVEEDEADDFVRELKPEIERS